MVNEVVYSSKLSASFAKWDQDSLSWKTSQRCLLEGWVKYSGRWPRSGMTRNGTLFQLRPLVRRTGGTGFGLWPTPRVSADRTSRSCLVKQGHWSAPSLAQAVELAAGVLPREYLSWDEVQTKQQFPTPLSNDANGGSAAHKQADGSYGSPSLARYVNMFPTPTADKCVASTLTPDMADRFRKKNRSGSFVEAMAATMWPTPTACQGHNNSAMNSGSAGRQMVAAKAETPEEAAAMVGGQLNPTWVEWLMGFPLGWTDCVASETRSCPRSSS